MRMVKFILIVLLTIVNVNIYSQEGKLYIVNTYEKFNQLPEEYGFEDENGNLIIPYGKYPMVFTGEFDKIAFVTIKGKQGLFAIDRNENVLFEVFVFDNGPDPVQNGLFRIIKDGKVGFANMDGQIVIQPKADMAFPLQDNGLIMFCVGGHRKQDGEHFVHIGGKWGAMDKTGKIVIPAIYGINMKNDHIELIKDDKWYKITDDWKLEPIAK